MTSHGLAQACSSHMNIPCVKIIDQDLASRARAQQEVLSMLSNQRLRYS